VQDYQNQANPPKILPHIMEKLREDSYNLDIDVITSSPEGVAEVCARGAQATDLWLIYLREHVPVAFGKGLEFPANMQLHTSLQFLVQTYKTMWMTTSL
jgi:hypothetical protein